MLLAWWRAGDDVSVTEAQARRSVPKLNSLRGSVTPRMECALASHDVQKEGAMPCFKLPGPGQATGASRAWVPLLHGRLGRRRGGVAQARQMRSSGD